MNLDAQTLVVGLVLLGAAAYVGRSLLAELRPKSGCSSCPQNRSRSDDYA